MLPKDERDEFEIFAREMYQENCRERDIYNEPLLTFDEYVEKNNQFLLDNLRKQCYNTCIDNENYERKL